MKFTIDNYRRFLEVAKGISPIVQVKIGRASCRERV